MSAEENKALVLREAEARAKEGPEAGLAFFEAMCDPACTFPDLAFYGLPPTLEGYKQFISGALGAFSDVCDYAAVGASARCLCRTGGA